MKLKSLVGLVIPLIVAVSISGCIVPVFINFDGVSAPCLFDEIAEAREV